MIRRVVQGSALALLFALGLAALFSSGVLDAPAGESGSLDPEPSSEEAVGREARSAAPVPSRPLRVIVQGKVLGSDGTPLPQAEVQLFHDLNPATDFAAPKSARVAHTFSDDAGVFRFADLQSDLPYALRIRHEDHCERVVRRLDPADGESLRRIVRLDRGTSLHGRVFYEWEGVSEGRVVVYQGAPGRGRVVGVGTTAADGNFRIDHLPPGSKSVVASRSAMASDAIHVGRFDESSSPLVFLLKDGQRTSGRVVHAATGLPIEGVEIVAEFKGGMRRPQHPGVSHIRTTNSQWKFVPSERTRTNARGEFEFALAEGVRYELRASGEGFEVLQGHPIEVGARDISIALEPRGTITGRVVDAETGAPISSFLVAASDREGLRFLPSLARRQSAREDGTFELTDLSRSSHHLYVQAEGYALQCSERISLVRQATVPWVLVRLRRGATLKGRITDSQGAPLAGARVRAVAARGEVRTAAAAFLRLVEPLNTRRGGPFVVCNADGEWVLSGLLPGEYRIEAVCTGHVTDRTAPLRCSGPGVVEVDDLALVQGGTLEGVVALAAYANRLVPSILISQLPDGVGRRSWRTQADEEGRFAVRGMPPGRYRVSITDPRSNSQVAALFKGQMLRKEIVVEAGKVSQLSF